MKITQTIIDAFKQATLVQGTKTKISKSTGIPLTTLTGALTRTNGEFSEKNWELLFPYLAPYLPDNPRYLPRRNLYKFYWLYARDELIKAKKLSLWKRLTNKFYHAIRKP